MGYDRTRANMPGAITGGIPPGLDLEWTLFNVWFPSVAPEVKRRQQH